MKPELKEKKKEQFKELPVCICHLTAINWNVHLSQRPVGLFGQLLSEIFFDSCCTCCHEVILPESGKCVHHRTKLCKLNKVLTASHTTQKTSFHHQCQHHSVRTCCWFFSLTYSPNKISGTSSGEFWLRRAPFVLLSADQYPILYSLFKMTCRKIVCIAVNTTMSLICYSKYSVKKEKNSNFQSPSHSGSCVL